MGFLGGFKQDVSVGSEVRAAGLNASPPAYELWDLGQVTDVPGLGFFTCKIKRTVGYLELSCHL